MANNLKRTPAQRKRIAEGMKRSWALRKQFDVEEIKPTEERDIAAEYDLLIAPNNVRAFVPCIHDRAMYEFLIASGVEIRRLSSHAPA
jgi:hypothetical protein